MPTQAEVDLHDPLLPLRLSAEVALLEQELAIRDALNRALKQWLPAAQAAVLEGSLTAAVGPDPNGISMSAHLWTRAVEGELQPTIGAVFEQAVQTATPDLYGLELLPIKSMRDEYWANVAARIGGLPAELFDLLTARLNSALDQGTSTTGLADIVKSILSIAGLKNDVTRIARTEATGAFNAGTLGAWQYSAKLTGEELDKVWIATRDLRTREAHRHADEQRVDLFAPFLVAGFPMPCPGWPVAPPELVINCRCSMIELAKGEPMPAVRRKPWSDVDSQAQATQRPAPVRPKQSQQMSELVAHVKQWQKDLTGLDPLLAAVDSGYRPEDVDTLAGYENNPDRWVARITYGNGTLAIQKRASVEDVEKEQLSSLLGQKMGVPVASVLRIQNDEFVSQLVPGVAGAEFYGIAEKATSYLDPEVRHASDLVGDGSVAGRRLSFFDVLIDESDRHLWDVHVDDQGQAIGGFDQEFAWNVDDPDYTRADRTPNRFANRIGSLWYDVPATYDPDDPESHWGTWKTNPLTEADVAWLRARMKEVRPQFRQLGRDDWWKFSWTRLQTMAKYAGGTTNLFAPDGFVAAGADVFHLPGRHDQKDHGRWAKFGTKAFNRRAEAVAAVANDPDRGVFTLTQGIQAHVQREVGKGGQIVRKTYPEGRYGTESADREELAARVIDAVGLVAPAIHRVSDHEIVMEFIDGQTGAEAFSLGPGFELRNSEDGRLLGLVDASIRNGDRNPSNWKLTPEGRIGALDGGLAFASAGPTKPFGTYIENEGADLDQLAMVRAKVKKLKPEFDRLGRQFWYDSTLRSLDLTETYSRVIQAGGSKDDAVKAVKAMGLLAAGAEFHLPGHHDQLDHGRRYTAGSDLLNEAGTAGVFDLCNSIAAGSESHGHVDAYDDESIYVRDKLMGEVARRQAFDALPKIVTKDEMDQLIADGSPEWFRGGKSREGRTTAEQHQMLRNDPEPWWGKGIFGNGLYFGHEPHSTAFSDKTPGSLARATLRPEAKIGDYDELKYQWGKELEYVEVQEYQQAPKLGHNTSTILKDFGRWAALHGWDAVTTPESSLLVLNRGALIVQEADDAG